MTIDLKSQLLLIKSLQDTDVSMLRLERELREIPAKIEEVMAEYNTVKAQIDKKTADKANIEKQRRQGELEIEAETARLKEREAKLYAIKTNKEYQAAIKEIADAKQANKDKEDNILRLMEKIDALGEEITQLSGALADKEKVFREKESELKKREGELKAEWEGLSAKSKEGEGGVDKAVLKQYRYIQGRHNDALAMVASGICQGCCKRIPPQVFIELQKWKELISCPHCHRLLFFVDEEETQK
jgi:predicted  nucleic acid-binding Zn-ribbon protein